MNDTKIRIRDTRSAPFFWISRTLLKDYRVSWRGLVAYNALAYYANFESGVCKSVGIKAMAQLVGVSEDTMKRGLGELEQKKAVEVKARYSKKGGKKARLPNDYSLIDLTASEEIPL